MPFIGRDRVSAIWGLGFTALMGYQLEPLVLVIPMLITARAIESLGAVRRALLRGVRAA